MKPKPRYRWSTRLELWFLLADAGSWFASGFRRGFPAHVRPAQAHDGDV